jgi:hypothetical protein
MTEPVIHYYIEPDTDTGLTRGQLRRLAEKVMRVKGHGYGEIIIKVINHKVKYIIETNPDDVTDL